MYKKINKIQAKKLFAKGEEFYLNPCKMCFGGVWHTEMCVTKETIQYYKEHAQWYSPDGFSPSEILWKGDIDSTAWDLMYNNWASYNISSEMGLYAHYYVKM